MTLNRMQDRIQYHGVWANGKKQVDAAQTNGSESTDFLDSLTQAQGAGKKRTDAMGGTSEQDLEAEPDTRTLRQKMQDIIDMLNQKVQKGESEPSFQIGAQSFTLKEWDRLIKQIDAVQEKMREQQRAKQGERLKEQAQKGIADAEWMDNRYAENGVMRKDDNTLSVQEQLERILLDMDDPDSGAEMIKDQEADKEEAQEPSAVL